MKLFLVVSDSHGDVGTLKKIIREYPTIRSVIHLGDFYRDAMVLRTYYPEHEYFTVRGNCDGTYSVDLCDSVLEVEGIRIFLTHGNRYGVMSGMGKLIRKAVAEKYDVTLFGHTHIPFIGKPSGCLMVNPGSAGYPRDGGPSTYALLEIGAGRAEARIMEVI